MSPEIALRGTDTESLDSGHFGVLFNQKRVYVLVLRKVYCELNRHITQQGGFNRKWIVNSKADPAFCTTSRTCPQPMYFVYSVFRIQIQMSATQESRSDGILNTFVSDRAVGLGPMLTCMRRPSLQGEPLWFETETSETHGHFIFLMQVPEIVRAQDTVAIQLSSFHALISWMPRCWSPFPRRFFFIRGTKDQDLILPTSNKKPTVHMSTWCYHGDELGTPLDSCLIILPWAYRWCPQTTISFSSAAFISHTLPLHTFICAIPLYGPSPARLAPN